MKFSTCKYCGKKGVYRTEKDRRVVGIGVGSPYKCKYCKRRQ